mmetsp:Transcript_5702/g.13434  ORF Transcript_5702/g.13434 Transcript_5702/m.13434 type:complete len:275 (-) Transcript_5702:98-922(-)
MLSKSRIVSRTLARGCAGHNNKVVLPVASISAATTSSWKDAPAIQQPKKTSIRFFSNDIQEAVLKRNAKRKTKSIIASWDSYLEGNADAHSVFQVIDLSRNSKISALELKLFTDVVDQKGVNAEGMSLLAELVEENKDNHRELDAQELHQWLNLATTAQDIDDDTPSTPSSSTSSSSPHRHEGVLKLRAKRKCKIMNFAWNKYLQDSSKLDGVFKVVDLNRDMNVSILELKLFLESVEEKGISEDAMKDLEAREDDEYEMEYDEFASFIEKYTN